MKQRLALAAVAVSLVAGACSASLNGTISPNASPSSSASPASKNPTSVAVTPSSLVLTQQNQQQLTAVVHYSDGTFDGNVLWASSDNTLVSVNSTTGMVTAVKQGVATITATSPFSSSEVGKVTVTVQPANVQDAFVVVSPASASLAVHSTMQMSAYVQNSAGGTSSNFTWSSSNQSVVIVSGTGVITGIAPGTATVTATSQQDPTKSSSANITVTQ